MKLTGMSFDLQFDRPIILGKHYISPGGYNLNGKQFDFCEFAGTITEKPDTLRCDVYNFDEDYARENDVESITPADIIGDFTEFFVYTGEYDDEPINPVKVSNLAFYFDGREKYFCPPLTLKSANAAMSNI